jgi:hypothetical protein
MFNKILAATAFSLVSASVMANPISQSIDFRVGGTVPSVNFSVTPVLPDLLNILNPLTYNVSTKTFDTFTANFDIVSANDFEVDFYGPSYLSSGLTDTIGFVTIFEGLKWDGYNPIEYKAPGNLSVQSLGLSIVPAAPSGNTAYNPGDYEATIGVLFSSTI